MSLNTFDWIVVIAMAAAFILGFRRGLVLQLVSLLGAVVAWLTAYLFYDDAAPYVRMVVPVDAFVSYTGYGFAIKGLKLDHYIMNALSFAAILLAAKLGISLAGHVLNVLAKAPGLRMMNRWAGAALGLLEAAAFTVIAVHVMAILPNDSVQHALAGSKAAAIVLDMLPNLPDWKKGL